MGIIKAKNVVHEFFRRDEEGNVESITTALDHVNLDVKAGQFIAILGHNGSGKSTLAKHINALLTPTEGVIWVDGMDVLDEDNTIPIRKTAGMVYNNICIALFTGTASSPADQIKGNTAQFPPSGLSTASAAAARHLRCQNAR